MDEDQFMRLLRLIDEKMDLLTEEVRLNNRHTRAEIEQLKKNNLSYSTWYLTFQATSPTQKMN